jgi:hypothetical protein
MNPQERRKLIEDLSRKGKGKAAEGTETPSVRVVMEIDNGKENVVIPTVGKGKTRAAISTTIPQVQTRAKDKTKMNWEVEKIPKRKVTAKVARASRNAKAKRKAPSPSGDARLVGGGRTTKPRMSGRMVLRPKPPQVRR